MEQPTAPLLVLNTLRHDDIFASEAFGQERVDVIGCGATGSKIIMLLAKLGVQNIHIWDKDVIESHNIPNQAFLISQIGMKKTDAIVELTQGMNTFARHFFTTRSSIGGVTGWRIEIAGGSASRIAAIRLAWLLPSNAFLPVTIS